MGLMKHDIFPEGVVAAVGMDGGGAACGKISIEENWVGAEDGLNSIARSNWRQRHRADRTLCRCAYLRAATLARHAQNGALISRCGALTRRLFALTSARAFTRAARASRAAARLGSTRKAAAAAKARRADVMAGVACQRPDAKSIELE